MAFLDHTGRKDEEKETGRIEAFSDGVFAIAITLLVLDIKVPQGLGESTRLVTALIDQWPSYFAFLTSFFTIGIMWINHHRLFTHVRRVSHGLLIWNGILLMAVSLVPFTTKLVATYVGHDGARSRGGAASRGSC